MCGREKVNIHCQKVICIIFFAAGGRNHTSPSVTRTNLTVSHIVMFKLLCGTILVIYMLIMCTTEAYLIRHRRSQYFVLVFKKEMRKMENELFFLSLNLSKDGGEKN